MELNTIVRGVEFDGFRYDIPTVLALRDLGAMFEERSPMGWIYWDGTNPKNHGRYRRSPESPLIPPDIPPGYEITTLEEAQLAFKMVEEGHKFEWCHYNQCGDTQWEPMGDPSFSPSYRWRREPEKKTLTPEDFPPGTAIRTKNQTEGQYALVTSVGKEVLHAAGESLPFNVMSGGEFQKLLPGESEWKEL